MKNIVIERKRFYLSGVIKRWKTIVVFLPMLTAASSSFADESVSMVPTIDWQSCDGNLESPYECASVDVPLDYSNVAESPKTQLALARLPATDQANKIGTIFFNPGGPGGSGVDYLINAGSSLFNDSIREKFDLLGFDPRGIGSSSTLICFETFEQLYLYFEGPVVPRTYEEIKKRELQERKYRSLCATNGGAIKSYMATANVARDMDLLRQAVGDEKINFAGYSYGSYLGVTYANLFPNNIRTLIVDGVLDPVAWSTGRGGEKYYLPVTTRLKSDVGARDTLNEFFRLCDEGNDLCVFSGNSSQRYAAIMQQLENEPLVIDNPDGTTFTLTYDDVVNFSLGYLYNSYGWEDFSYLLLNIENLFAGRKPTTSLQNFSRLTKKKRVRRDRELAAEVDFQTVEGFTSVLCSDSDSPKQFFFWPWASEVANHENGYFGPNWTWVSSPCAKFPGPSKSRYAGPFDHITNQPILVASTRFDPATPYHGAQIVADLMPNSSLLTVEGWGHTTPFLSQCADKITSDYLLTGELPAQNVVCQQDYVPFSSAVKSALGTNAAAINRAIIMKEITKSLR